MASSTDTAGEAVANGGVFPPFDPTTFPSQLLWLAISLGVLYYVMLRVIVPRFHGIVETREVTVARDLDAADAEYATAPVTGGDGDGEIGPGRGDDDPKWTGRRGVAVLGERGPFGGEAFLFAHVAGIAHATPRSYWTSISRNRTSRTRTGWAAALTRINSSSRRRCMPAEPRRSSSRNSRR